MKPVKEGVRLRDERGLESDRRFWRMNRTALLLAATPVGPGRAC